MRPARAIVYFAYLGDETADDGIVRRRLGFMDDQLRWLSALAGGSAEPVDGLVAYVAPRAWDGEIHRAAARHGLRVDPASVAAERRNRFEYPGFHAMKTLAERLRPDDLIYYCHSKGILQLSPSKTGLFRLHTAVGLTADLAGLTGDPAVTRAGLFPSRRGWCWHNFFWIKAARMAALPVAVSPDRYHFESLIGDQADKEGYRGVLPLIDRLPFDATGIAAKAWYRPEETTSPTLLATCYRYAAMPSPADLRDAPASEPSGSLDRRR